MTESGKIKQEIVENAIYRVNESTRMIKKSITRLEEEDLWKRPNSVSNSVGNLILHLCGNMHQYIISSLGKTVDIRDRDKEFKTSPGFNRDELLQLLQEKVENVKRVISECSTEELLRKREVQGFTLSGIGIILHVVEHYSYHTGQIAYWTKILKDEDLGFYDGIDLTVNNE